MLSSADLTTSATVTTITNGVAVVQPTESAYATNANSVKVDFSTSDPGDLGPAPTTHFTVTDTTTGAVMINNGTGNSLTLSQQDVYQVQYWSTDSDDSEAVNANSILIAIDRTGPAITIDTVSPNVLWPPNGKFVTVTVTGVATDSLSGVDASTLRFHVVDEYHKVEPSGPITDITPTDPTAFGGYAQVGFTFQIMLQARRYGFDFDGRHYVIDVTANDTAGNVRQGSASVVVPHDMGRHHGYHQTAHGGASTGGGAIDRGHGSHGHGTPKNGTTGTKGGQVGGGSSTLGGSAGVGMSKGSGKHHGNGNGHSHGNGNGNGQGNGHGNGNGQGNGNGNGHGNGNGNGKGHG